MKKILWITVLLFLLIAGTGIYLMNMPKTSIKNKSASMTMSAIELYKAYNQDEAQGNQKYISKIIEISGNVIEITKDEMDADVLLLAAGNAPGGVLCTFEKGQDLSELKVNDQVKLKGQCTGMLMDVVLIKCILVE